MCIKLSKDPDDVYLLSCNRNGVHVKKFSKVLRHLGKFYTRIVFRHLEFKRQDRHFESLEKFVAQVVGHSYDFTAGMITKSDFTMKDAKIEKDRSFFCSELVAKALK
jgi:hypothetical protein